MEREELSCRICRDESGTLIAPCMCSGSIEYVHSECLQIWVQTRNCTICEVCKMEYTRSSSQLRPINEWCAPTPLSSSIDDTIDFYCTILWIIFMIRSIYITFTYGIGALPKIVGQVLGNGSIYALWWTSFWLNFLYYGIVFILLVDRWLTINTRFVFTNRTKQSLIIPPTNNSSTLRTARSHSISSLIPIK